MRRNVILVAALLVPWPMLACDDFTELPPTPDPFEGIQCGDNVCTSGNQCCIIEALGFQCVQGDEGCGHYFACDGPEDCDGGDRCCLKVPAQGSSERMVATCHAECAPEQHIMCHSNAECPTEGTCADKPDVFLGYGICVPDL